MGIAALLAFYMNTRSCWLPGGFVGGGERSVEIG